MVDNAETPQLIDGASAYIIVNVSRLEKFANKNIASSSDHISLKFGEQKKETTRRCNPEDTRLVDRLGGGKYLGQDFIFQIPKRTCAYATFLTANVDGQLLNLELNFPRMTRDANRSLPSSVQFIDFSQRENRIWGVYYEG